MDKIEKEVLVYEIIQRLDDYIRSLFVDYHQVYEIQNGDIEPLLQAYLYEREEMLANVIVSILAKQMKEKP